jgi:phosphoribosyl-dephospho-CoA transferase
MIDAMDSALAELRDVRRHDLVWVAPEDHAAICAQVADLAVRCVARDFLAAGWPLVIRRQPDVDRQQPQSLAVGMPLPPSRGKLRLALAVPPQSIIRIEPPPRLAEIIPRLPQAWRLLLQPLLRSAEAIEIEFRAFGSAAWEALTGCRYLTPQSDIDLLWQPSHPTQIAAGIALLEAWEAQTGFSADGEICFGGDEAVAWREWSARQHGHDVGDRVLVKTLCGPRLAPRSELIALITRHSRASNGIVECA